MWLASLQPTRPTRANIIEVEPAALTQELVDACRARQLKLMVYHQEKDPAAFRASLGWGVQMINCNHGDVVAQVAADLGRGSSARQARLRLTGG